MLREDWPQLTSPKPISLPYQSLDTLFKGREGFLAELHESLRHAVDGHATAIVGKALHGLGGVGKTRLAVEYAWRHEAHYSALLFVVADSPENLRRSPPWSARWCAIFPSGRLRKRRCAWPPPYADCTSTPAGS